MQLWEIRLEISAIELPRKINRNDSNDELTRWHNTGISSRKSSLFIQILYFVRRREGKETGVELTEQNGCFIRVHFFSGCPWDSLALRSAELLHDASPPKITPHKLTSTVIASHRECFQKKRQKKKVSRHLTAEPWRHQPLKKEKK